MKKFAEMTAEEQQEFKKAKMEEVHALYKEEPIVSTNHILGNFVEKIKNRGFNFDPFKVIKMMDAEMERQYEKMFNDVFTGIHPDKMVDMKNEIIKWYHSEEERFGKFRETHLHECVQKHDAQVETVQSDAHSELPAQDSHSGNVTPIKKKAPAKKKKEAAHE